MNDFNNGNNNNIDARNTLEWVGIVLAFIVWWPVGLIWLILKLARPSRRNANSFNQNRQSAPNFSAYQSSAPKQTYAAPARPTPEKKKKEKKEKMPQDIAALVLLILGCVFLFIGLASLLEFVNYDILSDLREALF